MAHDHRDPPTPARGTTRSLLTRITGLERGIAAGTMTVLAILVALEPDILRAPFASSRAFVFTAGGTVLAAAALVVMLRLRVPPTVRVAVLGIPFVAVSWWLLSPYFRDDVVHDEFTTSIAREQASTTTPAATRTEPATVTTTVTTTVTATEPPTVTTQASSAGATTNPPTSGQPAGSGSSSDAPGATAGVPPTGAPAPVLLGAGRFRGLAGHSGTGDAGFFRLPDGTHVLRLENFDIQNGPDLRLYVVPGADRISAVDGSLYLGELRGNVGDQTYELPTEFVPAPGDWTVLVWCEAFSVEFVAATVTVA